MFFVRPSEEIAKRIIEENHYKWANFYINDMEKSLIDYDLDSDKDSQAFLSENLDDLKKEFVEKEFVEDKDEFLNFVLKRLKEIKSEIENKLKRKNFI